MNPGGQTTTHTSLIAISFVNKVLLGPRNVCLSMSASAGQWKS